MVSTHSQSATPSLSSAAPLYVPLGACHPPPLACAPLAKPSSQLTVGTGLVSILLIADFLGIGSYWLSLFSVLSGSETALSMLASPLQMAPLSITAAAHNVPGWGLIAAHSHTHGHGYVLDLNASWFVAASIVSKEGLFCIARKVADQENSPILLANAYHYRSDAYSSVVALVAILGSGWFPALPLDTIGGAYIFNTRHLSSALFIFCSFFS